MVYICIYIYGIYLYVSLIAQVFNKSPFNICISAEKGKKTPIKTSGNVGTDEKLVVQNADKKSSDGSPAPVPRASPRDRGIVSPNVDEVQRDFSGMKIDYGEEQPSRPKYNKKGEKSDEWDLFVTPRSVMNVLLPVLEQFKGEVFFDPTCGDYAMVHFLNDNGHRGIGRDEFSIEDEHYDYLDDEIMLPEHAVLFCNFPFGKKRFMTEKSLKSVDAKGIKIPSFSLMPTEVLNSAWIVPLLLDNTLVVYIISPCPAFLCMEKGALRTKTVSHCAWFGWNIPGEKGGNFSIMRRVKLANEFPHRQHLNIVNNEENLGGDVDEDEEWDEDFESENDEDRSFIAAEDEVRPKRVFPHRVEAAFIDVDSEEDIKEATVEVEHTMVPVEHTMVPVEHTMVPVEHTVEDAVGEVVAGAVEAISDEDIPTLTPIDIAPAEVPKAVVFKVMKDKNGKLLSITPKKVAPTGRFNF